MEEDFAPRYRLRGKNTGGSAGGSKRARTTRATKGASSDNEEAEEEVRTAWLCDLEKRSPADLRNAFTLKPCSGKELRQLGDEAFLGGKRRPGALPIYDLEGRVSLQFLLASYKASEKSRERLRGEDSEVDLHRPFLRWHIRKARELRLLNSREVRRGTLASGRVDVASKSGQWLLSLEQNQAEASDEEGPRKKGMERAQAIAAASLKLDVQFPSKLPKAGSPEEGNGTALLKERLRNQLEAKKEKIDAQSSHGLDLQKMCDRLMAPSLSFDWDEPESDEEDSSKGILQVEVPVSASDSEGRRALLREQIQRSVSFKQAKELSKVKSLPSSSSLQDLRNAATPTKSKKRKTQLSNEPSSAPMEEVPKTQELLDEKEIQELPAGASSDAVSTSDQGPASEEVTVTSSEKREEDVSMVETVEIASVAVEASKDEVETLMGPGDAQEISAETAIRPDEGQGPEGLPKDGLEISPTLRFEPEEPPLAVQGGLDISPTLPFDIDATALQEACRVEEPEASEASDAVQKATEELAEVPVEEPEVEDPAVSSEDEELKGDTRALRERAWLRHKRNMQAAQLSQEDDGEVFAPVGRAPKRRAKGSILMKN